MMKHKEKFRPKYKKDKFFEKERKKLINYYRKKYINKAGKR